MCDVIAFQIDEGPALSQEKKSEAKRRPLLASV